MENKSVDVSNFNFIEQMYRTGLFHYLQSYFFNYNHQLRKQSRCCASKRLQWIINFRAYYFMSEVIKLVERSKKYSKLIRFASHKHLRLVQASAIQILTVQRRSSLKWIKVLSIMNHIFEIKFINSFLQLLNCLIAFFQIKFIGNNSSLLFLESTLFLLQTCLQCDIFAFEQFNSGLQFLYVV